ncbi:DUF881 domain-containing protein [Microlunatus capsulatus]|uniref:Uncharacterized protein YlxW (UPF0749 family) n=1 Tax=Microlunatus capsulatus TaxID=99117 RepID=A0ABS4Z8J5_9ACTN|nr:DUF881 domain-containing protein [Microlunatus capsulatus]MBP2417376.1 uncharacterized protein YlxW (UPF0749 family) [Microlunatus capsulatus]
MQEPQRTGAVDRVLHALRRARGAQRRRDASRRPAGRVLTAAVCLLAGLMVVLSAVNARGTDLRPGRNTDLVSLVQSQSRRNADLARQVSEVRDQVDALAGVEGTDPALQARLEQASAAAAFTAMTGPAVSVTIDDAPDTVAAEGVDADLLVVHQQDIQAVVNALWSGGAEAMTIQGQRVISTTGVKCVGNTVVLHGIPYAPPYVVSALGDPARLQAALAGSPALQIYQQYVAAYGLVYSERTVERADFPAHEGSLDLQHAVPLGGSSASPSAGGGTSTPR